MPKQNLEDLKAKIAKATTVEKSAEELITGFKGRLKAAADEALANGASAEELAPITELSTALDTESDALQAAVVENTAAA